MTLTNTVRALVPLEQVPLPGHLTVERRRPDSDLCAVLRRAMGRAGLVTGYSHVCRRQGCGHKEKAPDQALRRCPTDDRKLWPKPIVRHLTFHDMRLTTVSLLVMAGANFAAVSKIARHRDPKLTMQVYAHLEPGYLLAAEIDRLSLGVPPPARQGILSEQRAVANGNSDASLAASLLHPCCMKTQNHLSGRSPTHRSR